MPLRISPAAHPRTVKHLDAGTLNFALRSVRGGKRAIMDELALGAAAVERYSAISSGDPAWVVQ